MPPTTPSPTTAACSNFQQLTATFFYDPDEFIERYQWRWTIPGSGPGSLQLWAPDGSTTWEFEVPADSVRDTRLCEQLVDLDGAAEPLSGTKRAFVEITTENGGQSGEVELTAAHAAEFEDLVLDQLPAGLLDDMRTSLAAWRESNQQDTEPTTDSVPQSGSGSAPATTPAPVTTPSSVPQEVEGYGEQCGQLVQATVNFVAPETLGLKMTLVFDSEQGNITAWYGQDTGSAKSIDFGVREGSDPVLLCRMLIADSEQHGHDGADEFGITGTLEIETTHPDYPGMFSGPMAFPGTNFPTLMTKLIPDDVLAEIDAYAEANAG